MRPSRWRSLTIKMTVLVLGGTAFVFALILGDSYLTSRREVLMEAEQSARNLASAMSYRVEQEFRALAKVPENLAVVLETTDMDKDTLLAVLARTVAENKEVYGSAVAFEPYAFDPKMRAYAPYYYKSKSGQVRYAQLAGMEYDYFKWDWYRDPLKRKEPVWSEPYFDEGGGGVLMCTYSFPFYEHSRSKNSPKIRGIVTGDLCLDWLTDMVASLNDKQGSYGFIISRLGNFITHPQKDLVVNKTITDLSGDAGESELLMLAEDMMNEDQGFVRITSVMTGKKPAYIAFQRVPSTGWSMAVVFPEDEILSGVRRLNQRAAMLAGLGVILLFLVVLFISRSITEPLRRMATATNRVAEGDLNVNLHDLEGRDEVGRLAAAFNHMSLELGRYIKELTETTAAKERIQSELNIASQIQRSILPSTFPPFPQKDEFELFALIEPAREVGGDFYDFFLLDENHLALVIADVSDKGVPAALFMMVSRTLIKSIARQQKSPADVLAEANSLLCQGNDAAMFVTLFLAYYDLNTGEIVYANGGHNPAVIVGADGTTREFGGKTGAALGFMPGLTYKQSRETLAIGETLMLYTDGVTEAATPDRTMFGMERFEDLLRLHQNEKPAILLEHVYSALKDFQGDDQFDDITMMALKRLV